MENRVKIPSWTKIILCIILFWPVGLFFLCKRVKYDRRTAKVFQKILKGFGVFFLICAVFMLIGLIESIISRTDDETEGFVAAFLGYLVLGGIMVHASKNMEKFQNHYIMYKDIIMNQKERIIENIALQAGLSCKKTEKELQKMINKGYFNEAYINMESHEIIIPDRVVSVQSPVSQPVNIAQTTAPPQNGSSVRQTAAASAPNRTYIRQTTAPPQREKVVKCPNCGGMSRIRVGTISECDFCGSPIS